VSDGQVVAREPVVVKMILMSAPLWPYECVCVCLCLIVRFQFRGFVCQEKAGQVCVCVYVKKCWHTSVHTYMLVEAVCVCVCVCVCSCV